MRNTLLAIIVGLFLLVPTVSSAQPRVGLDFRFGVPFPGFYPPPPPRPGFFYPGYGPAFRRPPYPGFGYYHGPYHRRHFYPRRWHHHHPWRDWDRY